MINIAYIDDDNCTVSEDVWQYDYGQQVTITGLPSLPSADTTQVHFSNQKVAGAAYAVEAAVQGGAVVADVPDIVLMDGAGSGAVWCFVFVCDSDDGETVYRTHFPVIRRPKPNIYNEDKAYEHMFARTIAKVTAAASEASEAVEAAQEVLDSIPSDYTELSRRVLALYPTETASGSVVAFDDGADDIPVKSLSVSIVPKQSGSGDPSPSNVRPISGWDAVTVTRCGGNLLDKSKYENSTKTDHGVTFTVNEDGSITANGTASGGNATFVVYSSATIRNNLSVLQGQTVTLSGCPNGGSLATYYLNGFRFINGGTGTVADLGSGNTFTFDIGVQYSPNLSIVIKEGATVNNIVIRPQLQMGSTATAYEPYTSTTYPISLTSAGTVYGGTLDVTTGVLTVTHGFIASYAGQSLPGAWISDRDVYAAGTTPTTGAQVCYVLATPTTYHLTPTEVTTLLGNNTLWSDAGDITLTYRADLQKYFEA